MKRYLNCGKVSEMFEEQRESLKKRIQTLTSYPVASLESGTVHPTRGARPLDDEVDLDTDIEDPEEESESDFSDSDSD